MQTAAAVTRGGRHTRRESFGAHRRLQKLVRLIARASQFIIERVVIPRQGGIVGEIAVFV
ncbi:Uncharacterized protein FWK35_00032835 [Aphis craccivora]|uniref:Uncharacterized protein n=1 Tax=Aphis craccivora TaxID=307492 RepID=A0A6G0VYX8_APHCR|nr:Uncharacterized protein FWK35_00032835 [Aphis craccivora]